MRFIFSGTGTSQGIPIIGCTCKVCLSQDRKDKRLRTSGVLQSESTSLVFDTGPDFRQQMLRGMISKLDAIVFTHQHKDHTAGMDDVRAYNYLQKRPMQVYANADTLVHLKREYYYIFENTDYPGIPQIVLNEIHEEPFCIGDISLLPIPVMHGKMPVLGFRVNDFAYITDAKSIPKTSLEKLLGIDTLVLNALRIKPHHSHFSLDEAIEMVQIIRPKRAFFTHISHLMGTHEEVSKNLPQNIHMAHDGLEIKI